MRVPDILKVELEFSPKLGVRDLPRIDRHHQSNVRGLYIVGDLADAPIIKVALRQGHDVAQHIADELGGPSADPDVLDVLIVGAGPAGIGAGLALEARGLRFLIVERDAPFATIQNFPKHKLIFSEPPDLANPGNFWFQDAPKEELVERWNQALDEEHALPIQQPEEVISARRQGDRFTVSTKVGSAGLQRHPHAAASAAPDAENRYQARRVLVAAGKRGQLKRLDIPGESLPHVLHCLKDPKVHAGRQVVVVGGGDSAVEAATSIADEGGSVLLSYRGAGFHRLKKRNLARLEAAREAGRVTVVTETAPVAIGPQTVTLRGADGSTRDVPADDVLVLIGTRMPLELLKRLGVRMQGEMDAARALWLVAFAAITWLFYVLKQKRDLFPFGEGDPLAGLPAALHLDLGFRTADGGFWGTALYSLIIVVFGIRGYRRYPDRVQKRRYLSLMTFQALFLFGIPELLAPLIIDRPWKFYALTVPWPLSIWSLVDAPSWTPDGDRTTALLWMGAGAFSAFVAIPLYVRRNGERFCSYLCGCGGLAETLGDFWRHLAPRGRSARSAERFGRAILLLAVPVTLLILNDAWAFFAQDALYQTTAFAQHWYGLMVDFWLASVLGVALYPYLGNRVWCRFFCPLRAWMEALSKRFSRITIRADDRCIGCGECTRYCQMGIDVQRFAQTGTLLHNGNSACIQCGICIQVCPMDVLSIDRNRPVTLNLDEGLLALPKAAWEQDSPR